MGGTEFLDDLNELMADGIPFFKKISIPKLSFQILKGKPARIAGIDIGNWSTKVVQLRYARERAILETYGEILSGGYFKEGETAEGGGLLKYRDKDLSAEIGDLLRESKTTAADLVLAVPAGSSFITAITFTRISREEVAEAIPYEARKYVPIPLAETVFDWEIIETEENAIRVILVAVPREIIEKLKRVAGLTGRNLRAIEIETFSALRSLIGMEQTPSLIINLGHRQTVLAVSDKARLRLSRSIERGSYEITRALAAGMGINQERAEIIKHEIGLSEKKEEQETVSIILPLVEIILNEAQRIVSLYNRREERKIQRIILTGGGSNLKGLVDYTSAKFGLEVTHGNPFARLVTPTFLQPVLREIAPSFSVAAGLALREITTR